MLKGAGPHVYETRVIKRSFEKSTSRTEKSDRPLCVYTTHQENNSDERLPNRLLKSNTMQLKIVLVAVLSHHFCSQIPGAIRNMKQRFWISHRDYTTPY